jgi:hypothetical protein
VSATPSLMSPIYDFLKITAGRIWETICMAKMYRGRILKTKLSAKTGKTSDLYNSIRFPCGTSDGSETISRSCKTSPHTWS